MSAEKTSNLSGNGKPMTGEQIKQLRELREAATPGEWEASWYHADVGITHGRIFFRGHSNPQTNTRDCHITVANAAVAAAAVNVLPGLLDELERLRAENSAMVDRLETVVNDKCTCGGAGPGEGCIACEIWHHMGNDQ